MKKVNLITSLSPQKQYAIQRWFWVTSVLCVCSVIIGIYFMVPLLVTYRSVKKEVNALQQSTKNYADIVKNKTALKTEHDLVHVRTKKMDNYNRTPKNPHQYIATITQASGDGVVLEALNFNKKNSEITLLCPTSEHATVFIKRLSTSELFVNVKLVSLHQDGQNKQFRCVIKSNIV